MNQLDIFKNYNVNKFMVAYGLSVSRKYRKRGIGTELLKARIPLCKALGIKVTSTVFSGDYSQKCAKTLDLKIISQSGILFDRKKELKSDMPNFFFSYEELLKVNPAYDFRQTHHKVCKLMSLYIE